MSIFFDRPLKRLRQPRRPTELSKSPLIAAALCAVLTACQRSETARPPSPPPQPATVQDPARVDSSQVIETARLPIRVESVRIADGIDMALDGGAIQSLGKLLVVMDRKGAFFLVDGPATRKASIPDLPRNEAAFVTSKLFPMSSGTLRAHDLKYAVERGELYASFDQYDAAIHQPRFTVARLKLDASGDAQGAWQIIFQTRGVPLTTYYAGRSAGGRMALGGDKLFVAVGDYSLDRVVSSELDVAPQNPASEFGKTFVIDLTAGSAQPFSSGHRSQEGLLVTRSGDILETEHGPRGGDELNVLERGGNYGWPYASYGTHYYSYATYFNKPENPAFRPPLYAWVPSIAPSALIEVSSFSPLWKGDLLVGSLKAQSLYRVHWDTHRVTFVEPIWVGRRIRDLIEVDNRLIIWTDDGSILQLSVEAKLAASWRFRYEAAYRQPALTGCLNCHPSGRQVPGQWAPDLSHVVGRKIGSSGYVGYSAALRAKTGLWDLGSLTAFLLDPQAFAPGTTMINPDLTPEDALAAARALENIDAASP